MPKDNLFGFTGTYKIASGIVTGRTPETVAFADSTIAAYDVGRVVLRASNITPNSTETRIEDGG